MRALTHLAALLALAAFGLAAGDFAHRPNAAGALGLVVLGAVIFLALSHLYGPAGPASLRAGPASAARRPPREPAGTADRRLDINAATPDELRLLPGMTAATAYRIVAERQAGGRFATVSDLARVRGLDPERVRALADHVRV